ncbi:MAG: GNAT family N-acetyltransferase [Defluviitaleaceae bacterium]|nr:GNAT family N-acetyltransferase [Defluviitaleaceae bacterium]
MSKIKLETKRLILRCQEEQDLSFLLKLWTDEEMTRYIGGPREKVKLIDSFNEVQANGEDKYDLWYVALKETGELIGMAGLLLKEIENENYHEVNYIIDKKHWNKGYATEIAAEIISYHKDADGIGTFVAIIDKKNVSSIRVAENVGMAYWKSITRSGLEKEIYKCELDGDAAYV